MCTYDRVLNVASQVTGWITPFFHVNSTICFDHTGPSSGIYDDSRKLLQYGWILCEFETVPYKKILVKSRFMSKVWNNVNPRSLKKAGKNHIRLCDSKRWENLSWIIWGLQKHIVAQNATALYCILRTYRPDGRYNTVSGKPELSLCLINKALSTDTYGGMEVCNSIIPDLRWRPVISLFPGKCLWYTVVRRRGQHFALLHRVQTGSGAHQPHIQWVPGALSTVIKRPGREHDHSPPSSAEVKNCGAIFSLPHTSSCRSAQTQLKKFSLCLTN
jgi:hypothetical protein